MGAAATALTVTGCSAQLGDRYGQDGAAPDRISDVHYIEVFRNADDFPNVAKMCIDGLGFAATSTPRGESTGGAPIIRVQEWDAECKTRIPGAPQ